MQVHYKIHTNATTVSVCLYKCVDIFNKYIYTTYVHIRTCEHEIRPFSISPLSYPPAHVNKYGRTDDKM